MLFRKKFPFYRQLDYMDCGPACLKMIAEFHGKEFGLEELRSASYITKQGITFLGIGHAAETIGLKQIPIAVNFDILKKEVPLPCIAHWEQKHFVVLYEVNDKTMIIGDPAFGIVKKSKEEFMQGWAKNQDDGSKTGYLMILEPTPKFYNNWDSYLENDKGFLALIPYFKPYKKELIQLIIGLAFGSLLQLILPFLTQSVVDYGINYKEINFVYLILLTQIVLFASRSSVEVIRGWILLYLTRKVNISLISDFLARLMSLPISYFDSKNTGDIIQRINDNKKVQDFLSTSSLSTMFGVFTIAIFAIVLAVYSYLIFLCFLIGSLIFLWWSLRFMKRRGEIDHETFMANISNQNALIQLLTSIEDIKLNGSQQKRRWEWKNIKMMIFNMLKYSSLIVVVLFFAF